MRKATVAALVLVSILLSMTAVSANNVWNGWHWKSDSRSPTVADQTTDSIYDVAGEVGELAGLATGITPTNTQSNKGDIEVKEQFSIQWFGLAQVRIKDGHITKGRVKLNTDLIKASYDTQEEREEVAEHVLCQELLHVLGLQHQDGNSCMNSDNATLGDFPDTDDHDVATLISLYGHVDGGGGNGDDGPGGPPCSKNNKPGCDPARQSGEWITVHVVPARGR